MFSGSPLQSKVLSISVLISEEEENGQNSWQLSQVKMFVESRVMIWSI